MTDFPERSNMCSGFIFIIYFKISKSMKYEVRAEGFRPQSYAAPEMSVCCVNAEQGFAVSMEANEIQGLDEGDGVWTW